MKTYDEVYYGDDLNGQVAHKVAEYRVTAISGFLVIVVVVCVIIDAIKRRRK